MRSLEELVLRIFYEGSASARDCRFELAPLGWADERQLEDLLAQLVRRSYLAVHQHGSALRYSLTPNGSERLATLVE